MPSTSIGDAPLVFTYSDGACQVHEYTVLGVEIRRAAGVPLPSFNSANPSFGMSVAHILHRGFQPLRRQQEG